LSAHDDEPSKCATPAYCDRARRDALAANLVSVIDKRHRQGNPSSTIRLFVLYYLDRANTSANAKDASHEIATVRPTG
jgi:predicted DNA-binding ribbon-helix-helix protein